MRGHQEPQASMFTYFSPEARVPAAHPLRSIEGYTDRVLKSRKAARLPSQNGSPEPPKKIEAMLSLTVFGRSASAC